MRIREPSALDRLIAAPRLVEIDHVDLAVPPARAWEAVRYGDLCRTPLIRALFRLRTLPGRFKGQPGGDFTLRVGELVSSPEKPGFRILVDDPPNEVAVGAIGKVWKSDIPFVHVDDAAAFAAFVAPDYARVAWAIRVLPRGERDCRVEFEVRVDATDEASWVRFRRYFRVIGIGSRFIRHSVLAALARELGAPDAQENQRPLDGDELLRDAREQHTQSVDIAAAPGAIWPWLVQMGCRRAGFYAIDVLDNGGTRSARELHPELSALAVGDVIPATPGGDDGFEVLRIEPGRCLVLGGLFDAAAGRQLPFRTSRPGSYWHVTWSFVLEPLDAETTRLHARGRAAFSPDQRLHAAWTRRAHGLMEAAQLRHLAARVEGRLPRDDWRDVLDGVGGAAIIAGAMLTPLLRGVRNRWGVNEYVATRAYPGDDLVPAPRWSWTHGIEIAASADAVWPWVAQIGADRGGFYSYQWLENLAGCDVRNAERIHPEWQVREGDALRLHPKAPSLRVVHVDPGRCFVASGPPDEAARAAGKPWGAASWTFLIEPLGRHRCRLISRYRAASSDDLAMRLSFGPALIEPIGFAMDRRMLQTVKARAEHAPPPLRRFVPSPRVPTASA